MCICVGLVAQSRPTLWHSMDCSLPGSSVHGDSPGKNTGMGCHAFLQGIFSTQGSNPSLPHCRRILYCLSCQVSPFKVYIYKQHWWALNSFCSTRHHHHPNRPIANESCQYTFILCPLSLGRGWVLGWTSFADHVFLYTIQQATQSHRATN